MADSKLVKHHKEPAIHIVKRDEMPSWKAWIVRSVTILASVFLVCVISTMLTGEGLSRTLEIMFRGVFGNIEKGSFVMFWKYLQNIAILLCLALALTPAFKMKFWNCGAEGQALIGGLAAMYCMIELGDKLSYIPLLAVIVVASILAGALWGFIPALFKALFNTNETLFTLMMNYIAKQLVAYYVYIAGGGSNIINPVSAGNLPMIGDNRYLTNIIIVAFITVIMYIYLKYSKHGYEISVVGESQNTARYIGINVKKVIIRTMIISGAVCGIAGMLLVSGTDRSINTNTVGGDGFTAIMVSWLGQFNPLIMIVMTAVLIFLRMGASKVADASMLNASFSDIAVGIVILCVVGCEFFIRYSVKFRHGKKEGTV